MSLRWSFLLVCAGVSGLSSIAVVVGLELTGRLPFDVNLLSWLTLEFGALMLVSLGIGYLVVQPIRRRLYDLEEAAALIASGRLHHRVRANGDGDELGRVAEQFNKMGETIEQQVRVLQRLAEENRMLAHEAEQVAALTERQRLARELHDSVSQQLFAVNMLAAAAVRQYHSGAATVTQTLQQLAELASAAQREMRALLLHLRPVELEGRRLEEGLDAFLAAITERHEIRCRLHYSLEVRLKPGIEEQLFRIAQEAVANVLKHADANEIRINVIADGNLLTMSILDDGIGIPASVQQGGDSYGIRAMRERAAALGGTCEIWQREHGTAVEVKIPLLNAMEER